MTLSHQSEEILETASRALESSLRPLPKLLFLADSNWKSDMEHVHRLRVATRRADAALAAFRPLTKPRLWKKVRRRVRRLRDAAREARTCDVHIMMLTKRLGKSPEDARDGIEDAIRLVRSDRGDAQDEIARVARRFPRKKLLRSTERLLESLSAEEVPDLRSLARIRLTRRLSVVRAAAAADLTVLANLHRLRLAAKRLRYSFEIFAPCFADDVRREVGPKLKGIQRPLGAINDASELTNRLRTHARENRGDDEDVRTAALDDLAAAYRAERESLRHGFLVQWGGFLATETLERLQTEIDRADRT